MAVDFDRYEAVRPGRWDAYLIHLKHYAGEWHPEVAADDAWLTTLPVGASPSDVIDRLIDEMMRAVHDHEEGDAWMEADDAELSAQLATVLSSHGQENVHELVHRLAWRTRKRNPDDQVRDLMGRGVAPQVAYETVTKLCQWKNCSASRSPRAGEIPKRILSPLPDIEADASNSWWARLRRAT